MKAILMLRSTCSEARMLVHRHHRLLNLLMDDLGSQVFHLGLIRLGDGGGWYEDERADGAAKGAANDESPLPPWNAAFVLAVDLASTYADVMRTESSIDQVLHLIRGKREALLQRMDVLESVVRATLQQRLICGSAFLDGNNADGSTCWTVDASSRDQMRQFINQV